MHNTYGLNFNLFSEIDSRLHSFLNPFALSPLTRRVDR